MQYMQTINGPWQRRGSAVTRTFHVDYPERPGPPKRLEEWL